MKKSKKLLALSLLTIVPALSIGLVGCADEPEEPTPVEPTTVKVTGVSLDSQSLDLTEGDTHQLTATVAPANATNKKVTFSSSEPTKVSVSENGLISALSAGSATITVTTEDGGFTASVTVNVTAAQTTVYVTDITLASLSVTIEEGQQFDLAPQFTPANATNKNIEYVSSDESVAKVENNKVVGVKEGTASITATALGAEEGNTVSKTISVKVNMAKLALTVSAINVPNFYASYLQRTTTLDKVENITGNVDDATYRNTYYENEQGGADLYKVGNLNPFKFHVTASGTDEELHETAIQDPYVDIKLERYVESAYQEVSEPTVYVEATRSANSNTIDSFQFTEDAIDNRFRLTIQAASYAYEEVETGATASIELEVIKGYNVYGLTDLTLFDNRDIRPASTTEGDPWADIRPEGFENVEGLVLHADITVQTSDLPACYLTTEDFVNNYIENYSDDYDQWIANKNTNLTLNNLPTIDRDSGKELLVGSVKDWTTIFHRTTKLDEKFVFEGNYFSINYSGIKQIYDFNNAMKNGRMKDYQKEDGSHGQFFGWNCASNNWEQWTDNQTKHGGGETYIRNLTVRGNGEFSSEDKYAGGLMMYKIGATDFHSTNLISSNTFTTFITQDTSYDNIPANIYIDRAKNYGSYNSMYYAFGTKVNKITNSYLEDAGGALFLIDEVNMAAINRYGEGTYHTTAYVDCENCHLENWITGQEPWFTGHNASGLTQMMVAAGHPTEGVLGKNAVAHSGKTVMKLDTDGATPIMNMICIDMCGYSPLINKDTWYDGDKELHGSPLQGRFTINNGETDQFKMDLTKFTNSEEADYVAMSSYQQLYGGLGQMGLIFHSQAGGHAMLFSDPAYSNGLTFTGPTTGFSGYTLDSTFNGYKSSVNTAMGETIINEYSVDQFDYAKDTTFASDLATGNYMSAYVIASAGSYPISAVIGMTTFSA